MQYSIAAIATVYNGRRYRSRLEARWAAFFDLIGWEVEYEPYDLGKWSPDFLLTGQNGRKLLVEIKPIEEPDYEVIDKMTAAARDCKLQHDVAGLALFGSSPCALSKHVGSDQCVGAVVVFHPSINLWRPDYCALAYVQDGKHGILVPEVIYYTGDHVVHGVITGGSAGQDTWNIWVEDCEDRLRRFWTQAGNTVQWQPKGSRT